MNPILEAMTGTRAMTDQIIASDLLISAKSGVWNYAAALSETTSPEVREVLRRHLDEAITAHGQVTAFMMEQGWYLPYDPFTQLQNDLTNADTALML